MPHNTRHTPLPRKPHPKITRRRKRRRVTLIAAFRCDDGLVLCADSLETLDGVPVPVRKLEPLDCGAYWLAVGGSGNGDLIDGFNESLQLDVEQWPAGRTRTV